MAGKSKAGHRQRLRERFLAGIQGSHSQERLLELLLTFAIARKDVRPIAQELIRVVEGQKGISFEKLFLPYVKGTKSIKIFDPYIRLQYQIYNLMSFCEILEPPEDTLKIDLVTGCDSYQEAELRDKLNEIKKGLSRDHIEFDYVFDDNLHDRWIETDTGWRIILGRGLDIFQKPDDKFTLGFLDQTKRKCKATTITYTRVKTVR
jgi:ATP-dependent Lon protease